MKLVFATNNKHKLDEVRKITAQHNIEVVSLADIHCHDEIPETADTLEGNALQKHNTSKINSGWTVLLTIQDWKWKPWTTLLAFTLPVMPDPGMTRKPICKSYCRKWKGKQTGRLGSAQSSP